MSYTPSPEILQNYAEVLINFALGGGAGIKPGEVVLVQVPECAKPLYVPLRNTILKAGGHPIMQFLPDQVDQAAAYEISSEEQLKFFPAAYYRGIVDQCDHTVAIIAEQDKYELKNVDPKRIFFKANSIKPYREWRNEKEAAGKFTWTLAMYGTPAMAADVGMTEEEYWQQIIAACYLDSTHPIEDWRQTTASIEHIKDTLNNLSIDSLHVEAEKIDLTVGLGPNRTWMGGSGRNIPSF